MYQDIIHSKYIEVVWVRLFSGGLDSGLLAWLLRERCCCYTVGFHVQDKKNK